MAGDVNLFLNDPEDAAAAELNVMVAAAESRRKGLGRAAVRAAMAYGASCLGLRTFRAVVNNDNAASLAMFERMGFAVASRSEVFRQTTLEFTIAAGKPDGGSQAGKGQQLPTFRTRSYDGVD